MILLIIVFLISYFFLHNYYLKRRNLPPGPTPLPILGNLVEMKKHPPGYEAYRMWAREFGPIYTLWIGTQPMVIFTDYEIIKKTFIKDGAKYAGRAPSELHLRMKGGDHGVIQTSGEQWNQQRKFAIHVLKDFGLGKNLMEERIMFEVREFITEIRERKFPKRSIDLQDPIDLAVGSIINTLLFGYRFKQDTKIDFIKVKNELSKQMRLYSKIQVALIAMIPILAKMPYFKKFNKLCLDTAKPLFNMYRKQIEVHRKDIDFDSEHSSDFCEAYLKEQKKHEHESDFGGFHEMQLLNMCNDLWTAGLETTSNTLYWGLLYVLRAPEVQKKIHEELDTVIGKDKDIFSTDRPNLHYLNATIAEVQRLANVTPFNIPHKLLEDVVVEGFWLPKDTVVVPQISCVLLDDKVFPDPYNFDPSRHLDENGHFVKIEEVIPFSIGKRACLGESIARTELFLFFANIFQYFTLKPEDENNLPSIKKNPGATMKAESYKLFMIPRK